MRNPHTIYTRVEVWRGGVRVDTYGDDGLPVYGGEVQVDGGRQIRRTLNGVRVDATDDTWDLLSPVGTELRVYRGFRYSNGESEVVPVGRFVLDELAETYGGDWNGTVSAAPDLMVRVQRARFTAPRHFSGPLRIADVLALLMSEVLGPVTNTASSYAQITAGATYERDRAKAVVDLATSIAADAYVTPDGAPMVADVRQIGDPVWTVDAGTVGVLYTANRQRSTQRTYSAVVAAPGQIDGAPPFPPQVAYDTDPDSPTYYLGPLEVVPYFMTSELFTTPEQAMLAAITRLPHVTAARAQLDLTAECNPALDVGDTILVNLPRRLRGQTAVTERHLVVSLTVPLAPDGIQSITTRSSVADVEDSE